MLSLHSRERLKFKDSDFSRMVSKESLELLARLKQAAQRNKSKVPGDQDVVTSDLVGDTSLQFAASTAPTDRGALLASAMSSQSSVASSVAWAEGRQERLERLKIKKATEGGAASSIVSATKPSIGRAALVSYIPFRILLLYWWIFF